MSTPREAEATVVKNAGSHYLLSALPAWEPFPAVLRGKVRLKGSSATNPVAVGDRVRYIFPDEENPQALITQILPRRNYVIRKSTNLSRQSHVIAANLDQAVLVVSLLFPEVKLPFLDRILVTCEVYGVPAVIVFNKTDLFAQDSALSGELTRLQRIYEGAGYRVLQTSARSGEGVDTLRELCRGKVSLLSGESGVGKSSLIAALDPGLNPKVGRISAAHLQGKHTTSLYEMYPLQGGGFVVDSPGLRGFGLVDLKPEEIPLYFPEMLRASANCRFTPCTHTHEPGCAVKEAVDRGEISPERYNSYLGMLEEDRKFR